MIGRVIRTRDVVFLRGKLCDGQGQYAEKSHIREVAEVLDIEDTPDYSDILTDQLSSPEDAHQDENEMEGPISDTIHVHDGESSSKTIASSRTPPKLS
jgi:hypothetical protein